jgi:hypothetical protein
MKRVILFHVFHNKFVGCKPPTDKQSLRIEFQYGQQQCVQFHHVVEVKERPRCRS